jgi:hypothetical protein
MSEESPKPAPDALAEALRAQRLVWSPVKKLAEKRALLAAAARVERVPSRSRGRVAVVAFVAAILALPVAFAAVQLSSPAPASQSAAPSTRPPEVASSSARPPLGERRIDVFPHGDARAQRVGGPEQAIVRVSHGLVTVAVADGELPVKIVTGDVELSTLGGTFDVHVSSDRLVEVHVLAGSAQLTRAASGPDTAEPTVVSLATGARWRSSATAIEPAASASSTPARVAPRSSSSTSSRPTKGSVVAGARPAAEPSEAAFREGWAALEAGDFARARVQFEGVDPASPVGEEAAYWSAMALVQTGPRDAADEALREFVRRHPSSVRRSSVEAALARPRASEAQVGRGGGVQ